ncbi:MAG: glycosyltransferase, partial [Bacteroidales bacterium]|nr:glycosyltransferase [Bacteroidales bacterium]
LQIMQSIAQEDARIKIISTPNNGVSTARNTAIAYATGEFIIFLDGDDALAPEALEACYNKGVAENLDMVLFDGEVFYDDKIAAEDFPFDYKRCSRYEGKVYSGVALAKEMLDRGDYRANAALALINHQFLKDRHILFPAHLHEDESFTLQSMLCANRVGGMAKPFYLRRVRSGSTMTVPFRQVNADGYLTFCRIMKSWLDYCTMDNAAKKVIKRQIANIAQIIIWKIPDLKHKADWSKEYGILKNEFLAFLPLTAKVKLCAPRFYDWTRSIKLKLLGKE